MIVLCQGHLGVGGVEVEHQSVRNDRPGDRRHISDRGRRRALTRPGRALKLYGAIWVSDSNYWCLAATSDRQGESWRFTDFA